MDHLPQVADNNRERRTLEVPCLSESQKRTYVPKGILIYCGLQDQLLREFPAKDPSTSTPPSFFQSFLTQPRTYKASRDQEEILQATQFFLYFAVLAEAFHIGGVAIDPRRFITQNARGSAIITTAALTEYICLWHLNVDGLDDRTKKSHLDHLTLLLGAAAVWLTAWSSRLRFVDPPPSYKEGYTYRFILDCHHASYPRAQAILLSIRILCETLHTVCRTAYSKIVTIDGSMLIEPPEHVIIRTIFMQGNYEFVDQLMIDAGWCPNEIAILKHRTTDSQSTLKYFLSTVKRRRLGRDHSRCNRQRCYRLMEYSYYPKHVDDNCKCPNVYTNRDIESDHDVVKIIRQGAIPLVRIRANPSDDDLLETIAYDPQADSAHKPLYLAISHVWSDGLGNRAGNFLPACQIRDLHDSVKFAHHTGDGSGTVDEEGLSERENIYFWIDTLCIPRHFPEERKRAIQSMAEVYQNAASVLVVDKGIERTDLQSSSCDRLMAICESNWAKRLWTLQEARLASHLRFNFANGVYSVKSRELFIQSILEDFWQDFAMKLELDSIVQNANFGTNTHASQQLLRALSTRYADVAQYYESRGLPRPSVEHNLSVQRFFRRMGEFWMSEDILAYSLGKVAGFLSNGSSQESNLEDSQGASPDINPSPTTPTVRFLDLCQNLSLRRTTEPADEAITMACLLGVDLKPILDASDKDRLSALLRSLPTVPAALTFFQGERYEEDGLRWIPKSFLLQNGRLGNMWAYEDHDRLLTVSAQPRPEGLMVTFPGIRLLRPPKSSSPERCYLIHEGAKFVLALTEGNRMTMARMDWARQAGDKELAVILSSAVEGRVVCSGILVSRRKLNACNDENEDDGVDYVRFEHTIYLHRAEHPLKMDFLRIKIDWPGTSGREEYTPVELRPPTQKWCLG